VNGDTRNISAVRLVSVEEYLKSSYSPDREYVDGILIERSAATIPVSLLAGILIRYFTTYEDPFRFIALPHARTQIIEGARYRVPDVILCPVPLPTGRIVTSVPWVVIEILSPEDTASEQLARFRDYARIGVPHILFLDPELHIGFRFQEGSLIETRFTSLELPSGSIPFDSESLFRELVRKHNQGRQ
jgi:Uma2 family endonuclease